jgi:hypothetical protein
LYGVKSYMFGWGSLNKSIPVKEESLFFRLPTLSFKFFTLLIF